MLTLSQLDHFELCHGWTWVVQDKEALARCVAIIALGHYRHVYKILDAENISSPNIGGNRAAATIKFLSVRPGTDPWHRDGWIFQAISWIAALKQADKAVDVIRAPHIIKADKGFDGLQLKVSNDGLSVEAIVVFEDKATDNPRQTIHEEVWAGIDELESGSRSPEVTHGTSALLEANQRNFPKMDVDLAISNILWKEKICYRVCITIGDTHLSEVGRARLFKGYDERAPGHVMRRRAETLYFTDLRGWMESFAQRAIAHVSNLTNV